MHLKRLHLARKRIANQTEWNIHLIAPNIRKYFILPYRHSTEIPVLNLPDPLI